VQLVVFAEPLGIHGIREGGAGSVQRCLTHDWERQRKTGQQQRDALYHSMSPLVLDLNAQFFVLWAKQQLYWRSIKGRLQRSEFLMNPPDFPST
jgi:hypothetical protein